MESNTLRSVRCDVKSCVHNVDGCECSADRISVNCTCSSPDCCDETQCSTFKAKENC